MTWLATKHSQFWIDMRHSALAAAVLLFGADCFILGGPDPWAAITLMSLLFGLLLLPALIAAALVWAKHPGWVIGPLATGIANIVFLQIATSIWSY